MTPEAELKLMEVLGRLDERTQQMQLKISGDDGQGGLVGDVDDLKASRNHMWGFGSAVVFFSGIAEWFFHRK